MGGSRKLFWGLGCRVESLGFRVWSLEFKA